MTMTKMMTTVTTINHRGGDDGNRQGGEVELNGAIAGLGGGCPSITFTVTDSTVTTSGSTRFDDGSCSSLKNGDRVEVKGVRQSPTMVAASRVQKRNRICLMRAGTASALGLIVLALMSSSLSPRRTKGHGAPREAPVPFKVGETLSYDVSWSAVLVAGNATRSRRSKTRASATRSSSKAGRC